MSDLRIIATYSTCCRMLREGEHEPDVVHTGLCRSRHGGTLGPTLYLTSVDEAQAAIDAAVAAERERCAKMVWEYMRQTGDMTARGCLASVHADIVEP